MLLRDVIVRYKYNRKARLHQRLHLFRLIVTVSPSVPQQLHFLLHFVTVLQFTNHNNEETMKIFSSKGDKRKRQSPSPSKLMTALTCMLVFYALWFIFILSRLENFHANSDNEPNSWSHIPQKNDESGHVVSASMGKSHQISLPQNDNEEPHRDKGAVTNDVQSKTEQQVDASLKSSIKRIRKQLSDFHFDLDDAIKAVDSFPNRIKTLTAYLETTSFGNEIPNTRSRGVKRDPNDLGTPPEYTNPLPIRQTRPRDLKPVEYPKVDSCHDLQAKLPVDAGLIFDENGKRLIPNTNNKRFTFNYLEEAKYCPVDADPFLPWIHDVFPSLNGDTIHFIAQNKRRCNTGSNFHEQLQRLEPQVALMQPISVKILGDGDSVANEVNNSLWSPSPDDEEFIDGMPRYRLSSFEDADVELSRFICRFHTIEFDQETGTTRDVIIGETFSVYPINYEFVNLRKRKATMLSPKGKDNGLFWLSNLRFDCPVPDNGNLRESIASGVVVLPDGTPTIYVDVVPIRTNPRFGMEQSHFNLDMVGPDFFTNKENRRPAFSSHSRKEFGFDANVVFGDKHVLPRVEASGRWANIPICKAPQRPPTRLELQESSTDNVDEKSVVQRVEGGREEKKPFTLTACVWASATFHTRGGDRKVDDTMERTREWIEYHLMMGFDHIYVYDNSHANTNETDLKETLAPFSPAEVTRIEWPSIVCNNNLPAHENTGERSSQYAAESSCRQRYGQFTDWIAAFDTDEYFVPMGNYSNLKDMLNDAEARGTNVLSFRSTRSYPNYYFMEKYGDGGECGKTERPLCLKKRSNATFLETYNCDFLPLPKPDWADRAKKQIYRPDYVLSHFVHYSTVTKGILATYKEKKSKGKAWYYWYSEDKKSERFIDELEEAVMIHSKTTVPGNTKGYAKTCKLGFKGKFYEKCRVGFPIPNNIKIENATTPEGYELNCYTNEKVTNLYIPKLREAMKMRLGKSLDISPNLI
jgi:hypothetical protein